MHQILQNLRTGETEIADVPCPAVGPSQVLVRTSRTLISAGTERMLVEFGRASWIDKARQQPDKVRMVIDKLRTDGLLPTIDAVRSKLDRPLPLGYCNTGTVVALGAGVTQFAVGDRVACNGGHAEMVSVPVNLCACVPDNVSDDEAAFTVVSAIALQGIRLAQPSLGESVAVFGLGLIGQIAVQLLRANGCRVLAIDTNPQRGALARQWGAEAVDVASGEDPVAAAERFTQGRGIDAVVLTLATRSSEPVHQAALMSRKRGRIVLVGVSGLELSRDDFYKKELSFQVSCSYGPGRYDAEYEERGHDYPLGYVRWTEQRNFEAVLDAMGAGRLQTAPLVSHRFVLDRAQEAYDVVGGSEPSLGILLEYPPPAPGVDARQNRSVSLSPPPDRRPDTPSLAFIGSGNYATAALIPAFKAAGAALRTVASSAGVTAMHAGRTHGFAEASTDTGAILADSAIDAVVVATRHDSHATFAIRALGAGKAVFVEKPLCLTLAELDAIESAHEAAQHPMLMVGFNRRFAPLVVRMRELLSGAPGPKAFVMTVNAGSIPPDHWTQDGSVGGGRIIGEACHFVDLLRFLAGSRIAAHARVTLSDPRADTATLQLTFADGSIGTIHYFANGSKAFPKERLDVFAQGRVLQLDNFRVLTGFGWPGFRRMRLWKQDKGQKACAAAFVAAVRDGGPSPIPFEELAEVARTTIALGS
jgi:predicted dehydrogenase